MSERAKRYNKGKIRHELVSSIGLEELAKVYTMGAHKYSVYKDKDGNEVQGKDIPFAEIGNYVLIEDASANWRKGQDWVECMGSVKRHIAAWEKGEDIDSELSTFHLANAAWGLFTLLDFYKTFPQGDNRPHHYLKNKKIGLDIDEVLADWVGHWTKYHNQEIPQFWNFDREIGAKFEEMKDNQEFWLTIPRKTEPKDLPFEPHCYITSRIIPKEWTEKWLQSNGFPAAPVYSIGHGVSKVEVAKKSGIDIFVDDRYENFVELNSAGICTYLFDAEHNKRYNVGYKRIKSLKELM